MELRVFRDRIARIRQYLLEKDLKALVVFSRPNIQYVSGFLVHKVSNGSPFLDRPMAALILLDAEPSLILSEIYRFRVARWRCRIEDTRFYLEHVRSGNSTETVAQWWDILFNVLREKGVSKGRVGIDEMVNNLTELCPSGMVPVDASEVLREMRLVKNEEELELIRKAAKLADIGQKEMMKELDSSVGKFMFEIGAETIRLVTIEGARQYGEHDISVRAMLFSPMVDKPRTKISTGDVLIDAVLVRLDGYQVENERTFVIGRPNERQRKAFDVMAKAQSKGIEAAIAGNKISDIDKAAQTEIDKSGYGDYVIHRAGHGIGLESHEYPYDMPFNHQVLRPGMVLTCEPGIYLPGVGEFRHSDQMIVTKKAAEVIPKFPRDLNSLTICP